jgi:hypothetical protein
MSTKVIEQLCRYRELQAQYEAFRTEHHLVNAHTISCATTARLEALDLDRCRWEEVHRHEIKTFGGLDVFTPAAWPSGLARVALPLYSTSSWRTREAHDVSHS